MAAPKTPANRRVAQGDEFPGHEASAALVVDDGGEVAGAAGVPVEEDVGRAAPLQQGGEAGVGGGGGEDDAVERLVQQPFLGDGLVGALGDEHHPVAEPLQLVVERGDDVRVERVGQVGDDDADAPGGPRRQRAAGLARHVVEQGGGPPDLLPRGPGDPGVVAQGTGDGRLRDPRESRHVVTGDRHVLSSSTPRPTQLPAPSPQPPAPNTRERPQYTYAETFTWAPSREGIFGLSS
nr:hypothetical protein [Streptomyces sp. KE1]